MASKWWLVGLFPVFLGASCSGSDDKSGNASGGTGGSGSSTKSQCDTVSVAEIESTLGISGLGELRVTDVGSLTMCQYAKGTIPAWVQIRYELSDTRAKFDQMRADFDANNQPTTDVGGLGDTAFSTTVADVNTVGTIRGKASLLVIAPAPVDKVQALTAQILARL